MALPLKKRPYRGNDYSTAKRLKRVERRVNSFKPEMKMESDIRGTTNVTTGAVSTLNLSALTQGTGSNERIGNKVKLWRIEIRGVADLGNQIMLLQSKNGSTPTYTDFGAGVGGFIDNDEGNFFEWKYILPGNNTTSNPFRIIQSFRTGYNLPYNGTTVNALTNALWLVIKNDSGATVSHALSYKIWFTDA